jgi:cell division septal protein FtsQ
VEASSEAAQPVEIELTSKKWKKRTALAIVLLFVGWALMLKSVGLGIFIWFIAIILGLSARLGAWWTNG